MKTYRERKNEARKLAIEWQLGLSEKCLAYGDLADEQEYFTKLGKKYGLLTEFRENGII